MNCDKISRRRDGVIRGDYSCHVCLLEHYGKHPDDPTVYIIWEDDPSEGSTGRQVKNTLEAFLVDREYLKHE